MSDRFYIWDFEDVPNALVPDKLLNVEKKLKLLMGVPFGKDLPDGLQFSADPDYPDDLKMLDSFGNAESVIPISPKLKVFLESKKIPNLEFIPVEMLDHRDNAIETYFLLHSTEVIDAIDKDETDLEVDDLNEEMYESVEDLVLVDDDIPEDIQIFRIKGLYDATCVSKKLADEISDNGFTGIDWMEIEDYSY